MPQVAPWPPGGLLYRRHGRARGPDARLNGGLPSFGDVSNTPWWVCTGGLLGAFYVFASVILTPRLGAATTGALILTGQVLASIAIDHFGLFRVAAQEAMPLRLLGAILIVAGVFFVQRF